MRVIVDYREESSGLPELLAAHFTVAVEKISYGDYRNRSTWLQIYGNLRPVGVYQCLRFVRLGLWAIAPLCEKAKTGEDEVLVNAYWLSDKWPDYSGAKNGPWFLDLHNWFEIIQADCQPKKELFSSSSSHRRKPLYDRAWFWSKGDQGRYSVRSERLADSGHFFSFKTGQRWPTK